MGDGWVCVHAWRGVCMHGAHLLDGCAGLALDALDDVTLHERALAVRRASRRDGAHGHLQGVGGVVQ